MENLIIVESPAKAQTIAKYLNSNPNLKSYGKFIVLSSKGHIRDLKKKELSIDVDNDFTPQYDILYDKKDLIKTLKEKARSSNTVYLATDYDREGEGIAAHLKAVLALKQYKRITFTEITSKALETAIKNPRLIDDNLVDAQETRRILDRLVGFKLSPLLWKRFTSQSNGLSAGRVQSAVLHIIKEKEAEITQFKPTPFWTIAGDFKLVNTKLEDVKLYQGTTIHKFATKQEAITFMTSIINKFTLSNLQTRQTKKNPDSPFITSSLQQEAYSKHSFSVKRTMQLAQDLYENGDITYMRTDCYNISQEFQDKAKQYINDKYPASYWHGLHIKSKKSKNSQEAHEAIRPTDIYNTAPQSSKYTHDHKKLYDLIWKRTIACFLQPAIYDELDIHIKDQSMLKTSYDFVTTIKKLKFNGFLIIYGKESETYDFDIIKQQLKDIKCDFLTAKNTWTTPPTRYNESTIIKTLESEGIGRPSTYATILNKLFDKQYIIKTDSAGVAESTTDVTYDLHRLTLQEKQSEQIIGKETARLIPTEIGLKIDDYIADRFPYIVDSRFTSTMEYDLDNIASGANTRTSVLTTFWKKFGSDVQAECAIKQKKESLATKQHIITINRKNYIVRLGKYGPIIEYEEAQTKKYIGLENYLKYTKKDYTQIVEDDVKFLLKFPIPFSYDNTNYTLEMGPYGMYVKSSKANHKMPYYLIPRIIEEQTVTDEVAAKIFSAASTTTSTKTYKTSKTNTTTNKTHRTKSKK